MNIEYMRTAKKSYMIVKKTDFPFEQYELNMILQNEIPCLLSFQVMLADGESEYWYDVSGMQSLKIRFLLESMDGKQIRFLLENLIEMKAAMENYLLDDTNICFSAEMIYFERAPERVRFCYIPGLGGQRTEGIKELFEEILQHLNHSDPSAVRMGYEMYERCARGSFVMEDCIDCIRIDEERDGGAGSGMTAGERDISWGNTTMKTPDISADFGSEQEIEFLFEEPEQKTGHRKKRKKEKEKRKPLFQERELEEEELLFALRPEVPERPEDFARTEVIFEDNGKKTWELVYKGNGVESDLSITDFPFLVGTDSSKVDGVLRARTVSRVHAKLYLDENRLFVEDFNSTNGTYVNRRLLPMNTPAELNEGDRIVFATEEYAVFCRRAGEISQ